MPDVSRHPLVRALTYTPTRYSACVALFVAGYLLVQPAGFWLLSVQLFGEPSFADPRAWLLFLTLLVGLGALAGSLWRVAQHVERRAWRYVVRGIARWIALATFVSAPHLRERPVDRWLLAVVSTAVVGGLLFSWLERWEEPPPAKRAV